MNYADQTVLITGGGRGLGFALARQLSDADAKVIICGRDQETLDKAKGILPSVDTVQGDVAVKQDRERVTQHIIETFGGLSLLINNAGLQRSLDVFGTDTDQALAVMESEISVNLTAPLALTLECWPLLTKAPAAAVVNIGSALGLTPKKSAPVYGAAKAGLRNWTTALRYQVEDKRHPIRIVHVTLPLVDTDMTKGRGASKMSADDAASAILHAMALGEDDIFVGKAKLLKHLMRLAPSLAAKVLRNS